MITIPARRCEVRTEAVPPKFGQVRRIVQAHLRYWRLDRLIDPVQRGVTELLANVHQHAHPDKRCTVEMVYLSGCLTVSVHDADPRLPRVLPAARPGSPGHGMSVVAELSERWGAWPEDGGKAVWFTLAEGPAAAAG